MLDSADDDDEENYDFEYESDDGEEEDDADLENLYYSAKQAKEHSTEEALKAFRKVIDTEEEKGEWGFKAHKQTLKLLFKQKRYEDMLKVYQSLLTYIKSAVTRNYSEKSLNSILDYISAADKPELLQRFYEATMSTLKEARNDRLWFKTNLKLGGVYLAQQNWPALEALVRDLHASCQTETGEDDQNKGTQLLEVYALQIQMHTEKKEHKQLKVPYQKALAIRSAIPHPLTMGIIRECGGKMHLREELWTRAYEDFFEAFKSYDESGSPKKITCLKYLVLANMLMKSDVDPFDAQESKPYRNNSQIEAMTSLVSAYQAGDIKGFEKILRQNKSTIMNDPFISDYIQDLLTNVRTKVIVELVRPYTNIRLDFIAERLAIDRSQVEELIVECLLDKSIRGQIDQLRGILILSQEQAVARYESLATWQNAVHDLQSKLTAI
ncbi:uncharacterized protein MONBRDRAFT_16111 [Monosiga brevicollis MX1]|uniref:PCI domain-containing protein n=1 Tax=Monosiga brevicollis TaxID=81824 RepID=A9UWC1_MONBE|nr:uncharacterized protein MONBRDRAFT_16111 [Monosiga brevicollis MX1]EDQ90741.1 predicted protein [Monosiga brevicollis MX1]|eukprot:XP_001744792.1 hypothetical protein [Monosiga brevicollis MX1]